MRRFDDHSVLEIVVHFMFGRLDFTDDAVSWCVLTADSRVGGVFVEFWRRAEVVEFVVVRVVVEVVEWRRRTEEDGVWRIRPVVVGVLRS